MHRKRLSDVEAEITYYRKQLVDRPEDSDIWNKELEALNEKRENLLNIYKKTKGEV